MISVQDIATKIVHPEQIASEELSELKSLSQKYPYTQLFSILYLKGMSKYGDVHFDEELQQHSFRISDRVQLYHLIHDHDTTQPPVRQEAPEEVETVAEIEEDTFTESTESTEDTVETIAEESTEEAIETATDQVVEEVIQDASPEAPETELEVGDALDESILHHTLANNYRLEELTEEELAELENREEEEPQADVPEVEEEAPKPTLDLTQPQSFTNWLSSDVNYHEQENEDKRKIEAIVNDFDTFDPSEELFGEVEKPKKEFFSPTQKAKESLSTETIPVSETLAKIFIVQGNYPQAISAYEQLSLKYPEKKIFFANQIRDLKKKLNK